MKKIFMIAVMAIAALTANAQTPEVGSMSFTPYAGVTFGSYNVSSKRLDGVKEESDSKLRTGFTVGAEFGYQVNSWLKASAGVAFANTGSKFDVTTAYGTQTANISANYINVPILANFYVANGLALKAGIQPAFLVSAKETKADVKCKDLMKTFDFQIPVGISYEYSNVVLDARYNIGLIKTFKDEAVINNFYTKDGRNEYFTITLGYKLDL